MKLETLGDKKKTFVDAIFVLLSSQISPNFRTHPRSSSSSYCLINEIFPVWHFYLLWKLIKSRLIKLFQQFLHSALFFPLDESSIKAAQFFFSLQLNMLMGDVKETRCAKGKECNFIIKKNRKKETHSLPLSQEHNLIFIMINSLACSGGAFKWKKWLHQLSPLLDCCSLQRRMLWKKPFWPEVTCASFVSNTFALIYLRDEFKARMKS